MRTVGSANAAAEAKFVYMILPSSEGGARVKRARYPSLEARLEIMVRGSQQSWFESKPRSHPPSQTLHGSAMEDCGGLRSFMRSRPKPYFLFCRIYYKYSIITDKNDKNKKKVNIAFWSFGIS